MPQASGEFTLAAPCDKVAEIARTALARGGWRVDFINTELCELAANYERNERVKGTNWRYAYHLVVRWDEIEGGSKVEISIEESNYQWTLQKCSEKVKEIVDVMHEAASRYQKIMDKEPRRTKYGSARWGTLEDIKEAGYWGGDPEIVPDGRLLVSPGEDDELVAINETDTIKHAIVVGPTGSGKTSSIFIPNLIARCNKSALVTEARAGNDKPDLYWKTARYRAVMGGQAIYHFDPDDLSSHRINPLDAVKTYDDARDMAQLIVDNTTGKNNYGDDVWPKSEANMLTTLIGHAASQDMHLGYIRALLREGPEGMEKIIKESPVEQVREDYRGFMNTSREGFRYGVVASLITRLGLWSSPKVVALTEKTDIDMDALAHERFTFYLSVPANKPNLKPVAALVFNFLLNHIQNNHFDDPPFLLLDEFTNFGMIPKINEKLSIIRHQKISFMLGFQDFAQLDNVYDRGVANDLRKQPRTRIFFRPADYEPAEAISKMTGKTTVFERTISSSGQIQEKEMGRWLIEPSEVMNLPDDRIIVFTPGTPPLMLPAYNWQDFSLATEHPPEQGPEIVVTDETIQSCREAKRKQEWQRSWEKEKGETEENEEVSEEEPKDESEIDPEVDPESVPEQDQEEEQKQEPAQEIEEPKEKAEDKPVEQDKGAAKKKAASHDAGAPDVDRKKKRKRVPKEQEVEPEKKKDEEPYQASNIPASPEIDF